MKKHHNCPVRVTSRWFHLSLYNLLKSENFMKLFKKITGLVGIISMLVLPDISYARPHSIKDITQPAIIRTYQPTESYQSAREIETAPLKNRMTLSDYNDLSESQRKEISDFVKYRYEARINEGFRESDRYDIIQNLTKCISVPVGEGSKYLSSSLIREILN